MPIASFDDINFTPVSNLLFDLTLRGATKLFNLEYSGVTTRGSGYGNFVVGPKVWKSKNGTHVLLAFRGSQQSEMALLETDPEIDADPIPPFMERYGDGVLDDMVTRVNYQKIVAGEEWTESAVVSSEGGGSLAPAVDEGFSSYQASIHWEASNSNIVFRGAHGNLPDTWVVNKDNTVEFGRAPIQIDYQAAMAGSDIVNRRPLSMKIFYESILEEGEAGEGINNNLTIFSGGGELYIGPCESGVEIILPWDTAGFDMEINQLRFEFNKEQIAIITDIQFNDTDATVFAFAGGGDE
jgi:hypothetical protein